MDPETRALLTTAGIDPEAKGVFPRVTVVTAAGGALAAVGLAPEFLVGANRVNLRLKPVRDLFSGTRQPPSFAHGPTPEYVRFFLLLERTVIACCNATGREERDVEMERVYGQLRRRPDGKDANPIFGYLRASAQYFMSVEEVSQAEFEGVVGRLARSARTFGFGPTSTNYLATIRRSIVVPEVELG